MEGCDQAGAEACARRLAALGGGGDIRRLAAARELARFSPFGVCELLHFLLLEGHEGSPPARLALDALMAALGNEASELSEAVLDASQCLGFPEVEALFTSAAATQALDPGAAAKADARQFPVSLGHLTWKARLTRNPDELARLATASEPRVVRSVLQNPRLTEEVVIRIAARRPVRPEVLEEVWRSPRWGARHSVRRALALNPYLPPALGTKLVSLLNRQDWMDLMTTASVHSELRDQARRLLEVRPPQRGGPAKGSEPEVSDPPEVLEDDDPLSE